MEEKITTETKEIVSMPRLGEKAPAFEALTTQGTVRLEDFKGSWLILFSLSLVYLALYIALGRFSQKDVSFFLIHSSSFSSMMTSPPFSMMRIGRERGSTRTSISFLSPALSSNSKVSFSR